MWNGKYKALTFSFDDGVLQDIKLIEIFNKYGIKGTFNLNSARLGTFGTIPYANGTKIGRHDKVCPQDVKSVYDGQEVAVHTLVHPALCTLDDISVIYQVETDRKILSDLCGYEVVGMAYPGGPPNNDKRVQKLIKEHTGVKYARSYPSTHTFELPKNLYEIESSVYFQNQGNIDYSLSNIDNRNDYFIDWQTHKTIDAKYGNNYLYIIILNNFKKLYSSLGLKINPLCEKVIEKLKRIEYQDIKAKQIVSLGFFANKIDKEETAKKLTNGGAKGLSTFMSYHILKALSQSASIIDALSILKEYYGGMISRGATTFWEDFDVEWLEGSGRIDELTPDNLLDLHGDFGEFCYKGFRHSLCHGWSCGPISFLFEDVLGIKVLDAGCESIMIKPNLGNLTYCKGVFPTPKGKVFIEHSVINGKVESKIDAPSEIKIIK